MTEIQEFLKASIESAVRSSGCREIVYRSEWLGYLPFGVYHWIECTNTDFTRDFPSGWTHDDLSTLERSGFLEKLSEYQDPKDEHDRGITYRVHLID